MTTRAKIGVALSSIAILFLAMDAVGKLLRVPQVVSATVELGYPTGGILTIGVLLAVGVVLYAVPRTMLIGAVYLTAYLGGAVASHFRLESPVLSHTMFGVYVALFVWGGVVLRRPALLAMFRDSRTL